MTHLEGPQRAAEVRRSTADVQAVIAAERSGEPFLVGRRPDGRQVVFALPRGRWRLTVGRRSESDVSLGWDAEVSRAHALLERVGDQWTLVDDGLSRNGTFVNGARIIGRQRLREGDRLCFGTTQLVYRDPAPGESETTFREQGSAAIAFSPMQRKVLIALCRPVHDSASATPATNRQIASEVFLSVDAVKAHLRALFERFGLAALPQNEKRVRLARTVLEGGMLGARDF
jgi:hypothetical protein